jgi:hypothetical protein
MRASNIDNAISKNIMTKFEESTYLTKIAQTIIPNAIHWMDIFNGRCIICGADTGEMTAKEFSAHRAQHIAQYAPFASFL